MGWQAWFLFFLKMYCIFMYLSCVIAAALLWRSGDSLKSVHFFC